MWKNNYMQQKLEAPKHFGDGDGTLEDAESSVVIEIRFINVDFVQQFAVAATAASKFLSQQHSGLFAIIYSCDTEQE